MHYCQAEPLQEFVTQVFSATGADDEVAHEVGSHLVRSNVSGHDSHGVNRIPQYLAQLDKGNVVPSARPTIVSETPAAALIDAHRGFGHFSTAFALDYALERSRQQGVAAVSIRHSTHIGRLGEYAERAAAAGQIAILTVGAAGREVGWMMPPGGKQRFVGANPWSVAVPADERPVIFDGSMTNVAQGKVHVARAEGRQLPPGCIVDRDGEPSQVPDDFYAGGALVPLGGTVAGHKGYSLGLISALLGGLCMIDDPDPAPVAGAQQVTGVTLQERDDAYHWMAGVFLVTIDPAAFGSSGSYLAEVDQLTAAVKQVEPTSGNSDILAPGEPERLARTQRSAEGIPIPESTWDELGKVAERFGLALPTTS